MIAKLKPKKPKQLAREPRAEYRVRLVHWLLVRWPGITITEITERMEKHMPMCQESVKTSVTTLLERKWASAEANPEDGRSTLYWPSEVIR